MHSIEDRPRAVREGEELDRGALEAFLAAAVPGADGPLTVEQFPRGYSNLTYLVRAGAHEFVLRRPPFGAAVKGGHDMVREYTLLAALAPHYTLSPRPVALCDDPAVLGAPFYLMQRVQGVIVRTGSDAIAPEAMRAMTQALADALARLHAVDVSGPAFAGFGKPAGYIERQVRGWADRFGAARTEPQPDLEAAFTWLAEHLPEPTGVALVHNDFKIDNVMFDPSEPGRIRAVLDWEMATVGDPLLDIGTTLGYWIDPDEAELRPFAFVPTDRPGALTRGEFAHAYLHARGGGEGDLVYAYIFGLCKIAVIAQQIYARYVNGHTTDERFAALGAVVTALGRAAARARKRGTL
jgi:aminoglycoside phosphotransferase (APT) family kinase protein